jgi:phenylacetate-CoA ligase
MPVDPASPSLFAQARHHSDARLQRLRLGGLLDHALRHSRFYARHWGMAALDPANWLALPPVHKAELMGHFDAWVTDPRVRLDDVRRFLADPALIGADLLGEYAVWTSSGTTGEPGVFVQDRGALAVYATLTATRRDARDPLGNLVQGWRWSQARSSLIAATHGHYAGVSFWKRQCRLFPWMARHSQVLSVTAPMHDLVEALNAFQPDFVASYPSTLVALARLQQAGALHIAPCMLWAGGEVLSAGARAFVSEMLGAPISNDYGASECMTIGFECAHGRLHVNEDWVLLEPVDAAGRPVPPGVASQAVLLTNLANRVQPILRYVLGDSVTVAPDPCPCGNPRMALQVAGRSDDTLCLRDGGGHAVYVSPLALTTALEEDGHVHRFQVRQMAADAVELRLDLVHDAAAPADARDGACKALHGFLAHQGLGDVRVQLSDEPLCVDPGSGKLRQVLATPLSG